MSSRHGPRLRADCDAADEGGEVPGFTLVETEDPQAAVLVVIVPCRSVVAAAGAVGSCSVDWRVMARPRSTGATAGGSGPSPASVVITVVTPA